MRYIFVILLMLAMTGDVANAISPAGGLVLVDAQGREIGRVVAANYLWVGVAVQDVNADSHFLSANRDGFVGLRHITFEQPDCTGQAYASRTLGGFLPIGTSPALYVPNGDTRPVALRAFIDADGACTQYATMRTVAVRPVAPVEADLEDQYLPPFELIGTPSPSPLSVPAVGPTGLAVLALVLAAISVVVLRSRAG